MDSSTGFASAHDTAAVLTIADLHAWLEYQLEVWRQWGAGRDGSCLVLPTGNHQFPTLGELFQHAFSPLHRYSDQVLGEPPITPPEIAPNNWPALLSWAEHCVARHAEACDVALHRPAAATIAFQTRSAGTRTLRLNHALAHAVTHCFWHLGGVVHLLRAAGHEPPQHTDLLFWAEKQLSG